MKLTFPLNKFKFGIWSILFDLKLRYAYILSIISMLRYILLSNINWNRNHVRETPFHSVVKILHHEARESVLDASKYII